jgi:hypothetical protein
MNCLQRPGPSPPARRQDVNRREAEIGNQAIDETQKMDFTRDLFCNCVRDTLFLSGDASAGNSNRACRGHRNYQV